MADLEHDDMELGIDELDVSLLHLEEPPEDFLTDELPLEEIELPALERSLDDLFSADIVSVNEKTGKLELQYVFDGIRIGYASLDIDRSSKTVTWQEFYPYDGVPELMGKGLGIGALAHYHTLLTMLEEIEIEGDFFLSHREGYVSDDRIKNLARMGITEDLPLRKEISLVRSYIVEADILSESNLYRLTDLIDQK